MAETLGSLCDKLTIVKLKVFHTEPANQGRLSSLSQQESQLTQEIDELLVAAVTGRIPIARLAFRSNKVYRAEGNDVPQVVGAIGEVFARLAEVNCRLWHEQEKVYAFETVPVDQKDFVVKQLAVLNLERTQCIDQIDAELIRLVERRREIAGNNDDSCESPTPVAE